MLRATGIVRPVDGLGRIVIPKELRRTLDIFPGTPLEIFTDNNCIVLNKYDPTPNIEKTLENLITSVSTDTVPINQDLIDALQHAKDVAEGKA